MNKSNWIEHNPFNISVELKQISPLLISDEQIDQMSGVASSGFWISMTKKSITDMVHKSEDAYLIMNWGKIVGFSLIKYLHWILYRYWTVIDPVLQWQWVYSQLNALLFSKSINMLLCTQNMHVIRAYEKIGKKLFLWKDALQQIISYWISKNEIERFIDESILDENWIFKGEYGGYLGNSDKVKYITTDDYSWFESERWDSLLVFIK